MTGLFIRSMVGCAFACGALAVGPLIAGTSVAKADALGGVSPDIDVLGIDLLGDGSNKRSHTGAAGGSRLPEVSSAPSAREVVVHQNPQAAQSAAEALPASSLGAEADSAAVASAAPIVDAFPAAPLRAAPPVPAAGPPVKPEFPAAPPIRPPAAKAVPIPATIEPGPGRPPVPPDAYPAPAEIPDSFRVGYADYLRAATTADLMVAAVPGLAGIAGFTLVGAYAGYRQARAVQAALLPPVATRVLL